MRSTAYAHTYVPKHWPDCKKEKKQTNILLNLFDTINTLNGYLQDNWIHLQKNVILLTLLRNIGKIKVVKVPQSWDIFRCMWPSSMVLCLALAK